MYYLVYSWKVCNININFNIVIDFNKMVSYKNFMWWVDCTQANYHRGEGGGVCMPPLPMIRF